MKYISNINISKLLTRLAAQGKVYVPEENETRYLLALLKERNEGEDENFVFNPYRTEFPLLKSLYFVPKGIVSRYSSSSQPVQIDNQSEKRFVFGVKACDLMGKKVLDGVFLNGEFVDPFYKNRNEKTTIISGDCTEAKDTCYCTLVSLQPYPKEGYDLNMSPLEEGYIFESGSEKGEEILKTNSDLFVQANENQIKARDEKRLQLTEHIEKQNKPFATTSKSRKNSIERNLNAQQFWYEASQTCVECNACNYVCPTCYCFLLYDQQTNEGSERVKVWDSCFHSGYARMAGGLTPRLRLVERFKNHYYHKFDSFVTNFGFEACSGCGRCINACSGKIDKRKVLKDIEIHVELV